MNEEGGTDSPYHFKQVLINLRVDDQFLPEITILFMGWLYYFNSKFLISSLGYSKISLSILLLHKSLKLILQFIYIFSIGWVMNEEGGTDSPYYLKQVLINLSVDDLLLPEITILFMG